VKQVQKREDRVLLSFSSKNGNTLTLTDRELTFHVKPFPVEGQKMLLHIVLHIDLKAISNVSVEGQRFLVNGKEPRTRATVEIAFPGENPQTLAELAEKIKSQVGRGA